MATVREATFELFRAHGMTTVFGKAGSTELPMLADFPEDFSYVLGLQELVVVELALRKLVELVGESSRPAPAPRPGVPPAADPISGSDRLWAR